MDERQFSPLVLGAEQNPSPNLDGKMLYLIPQKPLWINEIKIGSKLDLMRSSS